MEFGGSGEVRAVGAVGRWGGGAVGAVVVGHSAERRIMPWFRPIPAQNLRWSGKVMDSGGCFFSVWCVIPGPGMGFPGRASFSR